MDMSTANLQEAIDLIKRDQLKAKSAKKMSYSKAAKEKICSLIKIIPIKKLAEELNVSKSFLEKLKRSNLTTASPGEKENFSSALQFLEIPSSVMKDHSQKILPSIRFCTSKGLTIEIFE